MNPAYFHNGVKVENRMEESRPYFHNTVMEMEAMVQTAPQLVIKNILKELDHRSSKRATRLRLRLKKMYNRAA